MSLNLGLKYLIIGGYDMDCEELLKENEKLKKENEELKFAKLLKNKYAYSEALIHFKEALSYRHFI